MTISEKAMDARARHAAQRAGLTATKSRRGVGSVDNYGGFALVDDDNHIVAGERFALTATDVIGYCDEEGQV